MSAARALEHTLAALALALLGRAALVGLPQLPTLWAAERVGVAVALASALGLLGWLAHHARGGRSLPPALRRHAPGAVGLALVATLVALTLLAPLLSTHAPAGPPTPLRSPPTWGWWLGTDSARRDLLTLTLYGGRSSLAVGGLAVALGTALGALVGAGAALGGGRADRVLMGLTDLGLALPRLVLVLVAASLFGAEGRALRIALILGLTGWMGLARVVRTQVLAVRELGFVQAAWALGLPRGTVLRRHVLPAVVPAVAAWAPATFAHTLLLESTLAFLGPGAGGSTPSWGAAVAAAHTEGVGAWWVVAAPAAAISVAVVGANLLADGLQDALQRQAAP